MTVLETRIFSPCSSILYVLVEISPPTKPVLVMPLLLLRLYWLICCMSNPSVLEFFLIRTVDRPNLDFFLLRSGEIETCDPKNKKLIFALAYWCF